jgi:chromodomain-helicase-DNA-binding protein 4
VRREDFYVHKPQLVVVPLSTLPNWEREFRAWAPQLNVVTFIGNAASREMLKKHEFYVPPDQGANQ